MAAISGAAETRQLKVGESLVAIRAAPGAAITMSRPCRPPTSQPGDYDHTDELFAGQLARRNQLAAAEKAKMSGNARRRLSAQPKIEANHAVEAPDRRLSPASPVKPWMPPLQRISAAGSRCHDHRDRRTSGSQSGGRATRRGCAVPAAGSLLPGAAKVCRECEGRGVRFGQRDSRSDEPLGENVCRLLCPPMRGICFGTAMRAVMQPGDKNRCRGYERRAL